MLLGNKEVHVSWCCLRLPLREVTELVWVPGSTSSRAAVLCKSVIIMQKKNKHFLKTRSLLITTSCAKEAVPFSAWLQGVHLKWGGCCKKGDILSDEHWTFAAHVMLSVDAVDAWIKTNPCLATLGGSLQPLLCRLTVNDAAQVISLWTHGPETDPCLILFWLDLKAHCKRCCA
eukprot:1153080-Pelagomonas_calceolata.AAC.1